MKRALILLVLPVLLLFAGCGADKTPAETPAPPETAAPAETHAEWLEELPWEEAWSGLMLGHWELDPKTGKEALRALLDSRVWTLEDPEAKEEEYIDRIDRWVIPKNRETDIYIGDREPVRFLLRENGDLYWNGALYRPQGDGDGFLSAWNELKETGVNTAGPPLLTLSCGEESVAAVTNGTYSWTHVTRMGWSTGAESDAAAVTDTDWFSLDYPVLRAKGEVTLSFASREPERINSLTVFTAVSKDVGSAPVELKDWRFTPFAGLNTYLLTCTWEPKSLGGRGTASYILLIEGAETNAPAEADTGELSLAVTRADAYGCAYTLEDTGDRSFTYYGECSLLRRTAAGGLEWVRPLRPSMDGHSIQMEGGEVRRENWDWSHTYGVLEPGEYCLRLRGTLGRGVQKEEAYISQSFTVAEEPPAGSGPLTLCALPEGIAGGMNKLSPHRWVQTLTTGDAGWSVSKDFSLYRVGADGTLGYVPPEYRLPNELDRPAWLMADTANTFSVELAARYGYLPQGDYVLRRAFFRLDRADPEYSHQSQYARQVPEELVRYGDTPFTLTVPLSDVPQGVDPFDERKGYTGEGSTVLVSAQGSFFNSAGCLLHLELSAADHWYDVEYESDYFYLYFQDGGEWYPVEHIRYSSHGLMSRILKPGEPDEVLFQFAYSHGDLPAGLYRIVVSCTVLPYGEGAEKQGGFIAAEFRIREDGTGVWQGLGEAKHMIRLYDLALAERYQPVPEEVSAYFHRRLPRSYSCVIFWDVEQTGGMLRVTVYRDRELERAGALLGGYGLVKVIRGEAAEYGPGSPADEAPGSRGYLEVVTLEQPDPDLYREGSRLLRFTWTGEKTTDWGWESVWYKAPSLEVYDEASASWRTAADGDTPGFAWGRGQTAPLAPGDTALELMLDLGAVREEFDPEKEYRVVLPVYTAPGTSRDLEYYTCPLPVTEKGQA